MKIIQSEANRKAGIHYEYNPQTSRVGEGGMGVVYLGYRLDSSGQVREVAIKEIRSGIPPSEIERAKKEASLRFHDDNLVEMIDFIQVMEKDVLGISTPRFYVVSEFLHGVSLSDFLDGKIVDYKGEQVDFAIDMYQQYCNNPITFALRVVRSMLSALQRLHDHGYVHRDIDPSNIMITSEGHIKLIDFGLVKAINDNNNGTQYGQFIGKANYAAPELAQGLTGDICPATDLYAIGILFFQLLSGHVPFSGSMQEVLLSQIKDKLPLKDISDKRARKIIKKATEKKVADRFGSASEFRVELDKDFKVIIQPVKSAVNQTNDASRIETHSTKPVNVNSQSDKHSTKDKKGHYPWKMIIGGSVTGLIASITIIISILLSEEEIEPDPKPDPDPKPKPDLVETDAMKYARALAMIKDESQADKGLLVMDTLNNSSDNDIKYKSLFLMSRLYFSYQPDNHERADSIKEMQELLTDKLSPNVKKSHELLEKAVEINGNDYRSLYELGCDYMSHGKRGTTYNRNKAKELLEKANSLAKANNDQRYLSLINKRLRHL